ncbi:MAG: hypothetical protein JST31_12960 [Actinobacteria bacterium]|nr:hypothetical protein [Actinomycetota bacterium]
MRRAALGSGLAAALLALACALLPGAAAAAPSTATVGFHLKRDRYHVSVGNLGQSIFLAVETGAPGSGNHVAGTTYVAHGTATESRLQADFGEFGELSMRFHPAANRSWEKPDRNCRGLGQFMVRHGVWEGRLHFHGEGGYLTLNVKRVKGAVETIAPQCRNGAAGTSAARPESSAAAHARQLIRPSQEPALGREVPVLQGHWREGVQGAEFIGGAGREASNFVAATEEVHGRVAIFRSAHAEGKPQAVRADDALTRADLKPPSPFHGIGHYRAAADGSKTWVGDLFVSFPGAPHYQLTGDRFDASLELFPELLVGLIGIFSAHEKRPAPPCIGGGCQTPLTWPR